ncbi:nuclear receptor coactivator 5-like [Ambystoma mexicanum]|uniref:nuclear receptor coactivator 5-like n=1 Tax=Ambystoma mexicanum TaxID=8296 RepID=UPI0037E85938
MCLNRCMHQENGRKSSSFFQDPTYSQKGADDQYSKASRREKYVQFYEQIHKEYTKERSSDCVVVGINKEQTVYATVIGHQLQDHGLVMLFCIYIAPYIPLVWSEGTDMMGYMLFQTFPAFQIILCTSRITVVEMIYLASESGLTHALQEVKNNGSPVCILVEQSNVTLSSCTLITLHESIKIHRNMAMADASTLVENLFGKVFTEWERKERKEIAHKVADLADDSLERELYENCTVPLDIFFF